MSTYKTINGKSSPMVKAWNDESCAFVVGDRSPKNWTNATLIQWDGPPQRVFSESEVKELLNAAETCRRQWHMYADMDRNENFGNEDSPEDELYRSAVETIKRHNITL